MWKVQESSESYLKLFSWCCRVWKIPYHEQKQNKRLDCHRFRTKIREGCSVCVCVCLGGWEGWCCVGFDFPTPKMGI